MSPLQFTRATKEAAKLRLAIFGPAGSGKTYTALRLAAGLLGQTPTGAVAVIDTERGSASKYADRFDFDTLNLPKTDIDTYCEAIAAAGQAGYAVLIVDSLSHAWHELLDEVERLAKAKYRGNTWSAWSEGTPKQRQLVDAILAFDGHVIATMRTKTEWTTSTDDRGRTAPKRVGLAPEQGKGIEYEFDLLMEINPDHVASIIKDRTGKYQDKTITKPGEDLGRDLAAWLAEGKQPVSAPPASPSPSEPVTTPRPDKQPAAAPTPKANGKCPVCQATGGAHAPWCKEVDGNRVDTRRAKAPEAAKQKLAKVSTGGWQSALERLASAVPYYAKDGRPDSYHALGVASKLGYLEITAANLDEVLDGLSQYARDKSEPAPLVDGDGNLLPAES